MKTFIYLCAGIFLLSCTEKKEEANNEHEKKISVIDSVSTVVKSSKDSLKTKSDDLDQSVDDLKNEFKLDQSEKKK